MTYSITFLVLYYDGVLNFLRSTIGSTSFGFSQTTALRMLKIVKTPAKYRDNIAFIT